MKLPRRAALGLAFGLVAGGAVAQELPKSMRIIVPFRPVARPTFWRATSLRN
jgi:hypothetical protein